MIRLAVCAGFREAGRVNPEALKPRLVADTPLMVSAAVPEEITVTLCAAVVPIWTSPKLTLAGCRRRPGVAGLASPVPLSETVAGAERPLVARLMDPLAAPGPEGANFNVRM